MDNEIHVWRASLDAPAASVASLARTLAPDEQARASRFSFARDQRRFVVGRGLLRRILGRYLNMEPAQIQFCYSPGGKPELAAAPDVMDWRFNVSHSQGLVVIGITRGRQIGIDIEHVRPLANLGQLRQRICSPREQTMLRALPPGEQSTTVLRCWTHKEAYVKACGSGLDQPVTEIEVLPTAGETVRRLLVAGNLSRRWQVWEFAPAWGYVGTLVADGAPAHISWWQWPEWL